MANGDAQFIFETNLPQVRQEIQTELGRIAGAVNEAQGPQGGSFVGGLTKGITSDVSKAIAEIRRIKAEAETTVASGGTRAAGTPTVSLQFSDVITGLTKQIEDRVRRAALKAGTDLGDLDLAGIMRQLDQAFTKRARDEARNLIRGVERTGTGQAQSVFGSTGDIRTGVPRTTLTTPAELQQQVADEKRARQEDAAAARRLARSTDADAQAHDEQAADTRQETGQRRTRRRRLAQSEDALATANEQAAAASRDSSRRARIVRLDPEAAQQAESARVLRGVASSDPNFGYATRTGAPGSAVVDRTDPANLRFFREVNNGAGYEEIARETPKYARLLRQENERLERQRQAEDQAEAERLAAMRTNTQRLLGRMEIQDPSVGYATKRGTPGKYAFEGLDPDSTRIYKNTGSKTDPQFQELDRGSKDFAQVQARLTPILEQLRSVLAQRVEAERVSADRDFELAAEAAILKVALSRRIRASLMAADGEYEFLTKNNTPSQRVYNTGTGQLFSENGAGGYDEITEADREYVRSRRQHSRVVADRAVKEQVEGEQDAAAEQERLAATRRYVQSQEIKAALAEGDRSVQYLTDSGRPTARVAVGQNGEAPTSDTARYFQRRGDDYEELHAGDARYIEAQNLLAAQIRDRTTSERRAREASDQLAESLRKQAAAKVGAGGSGGFGGGLQTGLFSGGFGDNGEAGFYGIGRALGTTVKYDLLYKSFNLLLGVLSQAGQEFLNVDDSVTELQVAMTSGSEVTTDFVNRLQDIAAPGGFNVGDAMDQAAAAVRAYRDEIEQATEAQGKFAGEQLQQDIGVNAAAAATKVAVIAKTTLPDAAQNNRATALGFGLDPLTGGSQVADAIANAKLIGGGLEKDISQGGANIAEVARSAGFSLQEALSIVSKISAETDESGTLAATRFSRLVGTLQGQSGKNYLTQLNQSLPQDKQVDVNASPRDQLLQLVGAYGALNDAQKQQTASAIGGQAQQKEYNVLIQNFAKLAKDSANAQVGLADQEYQKRLDNVRGLLGQIRGELRGIVTNFATSGALDLFVVALKAAIPVLDLIRSVTGFIRKELDRMPEAVKATGGALLGVLAILKGIDFFKSRGGGSLGQGIKNVVNNAETIVRPETQLARQQLTFQGAETTRAASLSRIAEGEAAGTLSTGAASKARVQAEQDFRNAIRVETANYTREAKLGARAVAEGGAQIGREATRSAGLARRWGDAVRPDGISTSLKAGAAGVREAIAELAAAIRGGAAQVGVAGAEGATVGAAENGVRDVLPAAAAGGTRTLGGRVGGFLGRSVGNLGSGLGALLAPEILVPMLGLAGIDAGLNLKSTGESVDAAQRSIDSTRSVPIPEGAAALTAAAQANAQAAKTMTEATGGVFGGIINFLQGGAAGRSGADIQATSSAEKKLADRLNAQQSAASTKTGTEALSAQINLSTGDDVNTSVKNLLDAGQSASSVLDALALALKGLKFAATGNVRDLSALQQTDFAGRMGIAAGQEVPNSREALQRQIDDENGVVNRALDPKQRDAARRRRDQLQGQLDALNKTGQQGVTDTTTGIVTDFFKNNPNANLTDPKVVQGIQRQIVGALTKQGVDKGSAALAGLAATRDLAAERQKFLTGLATPQVAGALVDSTIATAQLESDRVTSDTKLTSLRTGTPDRSVSAGLKTFGRRMETSKANIEADIKAMDDAGLNSGALRLQLGKILNAISDNRVKQLEQLAADAKDDISDLEKRRKADQAAATSAKSVQEIGDKFITQELDKALPTMDPDLIASVMERASKRELDAYQKQLEANLAADAASVEAERKREIALGLLNPDGTAVQDRPSPLAPGAPNPADSLPGFLQQKKTLPKPLQDLLDKQGSDQKAYELYKKLSGETNTTNAAETGSDVPGGTPEERAASALAAKGEQNRDSTVMAQAKVDAAKANLDKQKKGTQEYNQAQEAYYAALNAQADLAQDTSIAQSKASLYPGDKVGAAKVALDEATNAVGRFAKGSKEYWDAVGKQVQAQYDYATAQRDQASLIAQTHIDLTDPVQVANQALKDAKDKRAYDKAHGADDGTIAGDQLDVENKRNAAQDAAFRQQLSDAQTAESLGRMSHAAYMRFLQGEHDRLTERLKGMKKTDNGYRQAIDQLNEVDKDIKEAGNQLTGQFNLGDIKIPTVYEVRRSLGTVTGTNVTQTTNAAQAANTTNNVTVNGADFARVVDYLNTLFGKTARVTTKRRKA